MMKKKKVVLDKLQQKIPSLSGTDKEVMVQP